jgi:hypothetical protein
LFSPLKVLFGFDYAMIATLMCGAITGGYAIWLCRHQADRAVISFLVCASLALGMMTFADYHLTIFMLPLIAALADPRPLTIARFTALLVSALVLAPKNEWYLNAALGLSYQIVINPFIILVGAVAIFVPASMKPVQVCADDAVVPGVDHPVRLGLVDRIGRRLAALPRRPRRTP